MEDVKILLKGLFVVQKTEESTKKLDLSLFKDFVFEPIADGSWDDGLNEQIAVHVQNAIMENLGMSFEYADEVATSLMGIFEQDQLFSGTDDIQGAMIQASFKYLEWAGLLDNPNYSDLNEVAKYYVDPEPSDTEQDKIETMVIEFLKQNFVGAEELTEEEYEKIRLKPKANNFIGALDSLREMRFFDEHNIPQIGKLRKLFEGKRLNDETFVKVMKDVKSDFGAESLEEQIYNFTSKEANEISRCLLYENRFAVHSPKNNDWTTWKYVFEPETDEVVDAILKSFKHLVVMTENFIGGTESLYYWDDLTEIYKPLPTDGDFSLATLVNSYYPKATKKQVNEVRVRLMGGNLRKVIRETNPHLIPFKNGVWNDQARRLEKHDPNRIFTHKLNVDYIWDESQADCPFNVDAFILQMAGGDENRANHIWRMIGEAVYINYKSSRAWYMIGRGSDGKSTLINLLMDILGTFAQTSNLEDMSDKKKEKYTTGQLYQAKLIVGDENNIDVKIHGMTMFKTIVRGGSLSIRLMNTDPFAGTIQATIIQAGNGLPQLATVDNPVLKRFTFINTFNLFEEHLNPTGFKTLDEETVNEALDMTKNPNLHRYLASEAARRFSSLKDLPPLEDDAKRKAELLDNEKSLVGFINDIFKVLPPSKYPRDLIYDMYVAYCEEDGITPEAEKGKQFWKMFKEAVPMSDFANNIDTDLSGNKSGFQGSHYDSLFSYLTEKELIPVGFVRKRSTYVEFL